MVPMSFKIIDHYLFLKENKLKVEIELLQTQNETAVKEKKSLEELNTTWSQKIVEQGNEIESMRKKMTEVETSKEETVKKLDVETGKVEALEEKLKMEVMI